MIKHFNINEDHIRLIQNIKLDKFLFSGNGDFSDSNQERRYAWGIDQYNLFGGTFVLEDVALLIGLFDMYQPGTEESPTGRKYPPAIADYMYDLYQYVWDNMEYVIDLVFKSATTDLGRIIPGEYTFNTKTREWKFVREDEQETLTRKILRERKEAAEKLKAEAEEKNEPEN